MSGVSPHRVRCLSFPVTSLARPTENTRAATALAAGRQSPGHMPPSLARQVRHAMPRVELRCCGALGSERSKVDVPPPDTWRDAQEARWVSPGMTDRGSRSSTKSLRLALL